jgi:hypothetical protein
VIVPALSLFSFSVVANAAGIGAKSPVEAAAAKVVPKPPPPPPPPAKTDGGGKKDDDGTDGALVEIKAHGKEVCWISASQLRRVSAVYRTTTTSIRVNGTTYTLVTVFGADEGALRKLLGTSATKCELVHIVHWFFLPFDPNLS